MAAIFGVRGYAYSLYPPPPPPPRVNPKRRTTLTGRGDNGGAVSKWKKSRRDKNRDYDDNLINGSTKKKNIRKRTSE